MTVVMIIHLLFISSSSDLQPVRTYLATVAGTYLRVAYVYDCIIWSKGRHMYVNEEIQ